METGQLLPYIGRLIAATMAGGARWVQTNPSTLSWDIEGSAPAQVVLQTVSARARKYIGKKLPDTTTERYYLLQVIDKVNSEEVLSVDGSSDTELNGQLATLFAVATDTATQRVLDFLDAIIPPTPHASVVK